MQPRPEDSAGPQDPASPQDPGTEPEELEDSPSSDTRTRGGVRRAIMAVTAYAALAVLAAARLDGKPRLVVWLFLGLFAVKTLLVVLKERSH